jgi:membrane dipeptidase
LKIIDTHCDALGRIWSKHREIRFSDSNELHTNLSRLQAGEVCLQCFAIFVPAHIKTEQKFQVALEQIDIFHTEILAKHPMVKHITCWDDFENLKPGEIGGILTLEGADVIGNDLTKLRILYRLGIMSIGLTWNGSNLCADGVEEKRGAGLTELGEQVVILNNQELVWTDVSHLSEKSFWDVMDLAKYPIASHSNSRALYDHPRNLSDHQAEVLFKQNGFVGIGFYPPFVKVEGVASIGDLITHIDHFCFLGGVNHICLGSDFDGVELTIKDLENSSMYQNLINELLKHFKEEEVKGFAYRNFLNHRPTKEDIPTNNKQYS